MSKNQYKSAVTGILMLLAFTIGCTKIDTTTLGENLIPAVDNLHTFDTTYSVIAVNYDSTQCDTMQRADLQALGIITNDPLFGATKANLYAEFKPDYFPYNFPAADANSINIDSAVIVLSYSHSYGDTNSVQKVNVYQLSDSFDLSQNFTNCLNLGYDSSVLLGQKTYYPWVLKDSVHAFNEEAANQLRIPISTSLIQNFINDSTQIFRSDADFKSYFKGFALVPDTQTGGQALNYFDFTTSHLSIYMRYKQSGVADTTVVNFSLSNSSGLSNSIVHDRGSSEIASHLSQPASGDSLVFIQTSPGSYALLTIPAITGLSNRVINSAEIILDQVYSPNSFNNIFSPPANLYVETKDPFINNGTYIPIPCDFSASELQTGFQYMGGQMVSTTNSLGQSIAEYHLNITRYVQAIVTKGKQAFTLKLSAPHFITNTASYTDWCGQGIGPFSSRRNAIAEGRVELNGTNNTATHIRLHVIYSTL